MSQLNRRNALAAVAALPALAVPAAAIGAPDPIFAAIDARRLAMASWMAMKVEGEDFEKAGDAEWDATRQMCTTVPTTLAGMHALLRYVVECENEGDEISETYMEKLEREDEWNRPKAGHALLVTLAIATERLVSVS